jgi:hypothetical protein
MKYNAVILNFDRKTVNYVPVKDVPTKPSKTMVASASGSTPPVKRPPK